MINGYSLPYVNKYSSMEFQYKRAILSLVLFKPFRSVSDLIGVGPVCDEVWLHAYDQWETNRSEFARTIMNNMNDYYSGLRFAKDQNAEREQSLQDVNGGGTASVPDDDCNDHDDLYDIDEFQDFADCDDNGDDSDGVCSIWDPNNDSRRIIESSSVHPSVCPSAAIPDNIIMPILTTFNEFHMLEGVAKKTAAVANLAGPVLDNIPVRSWGQWIIDARTDNALTLASADDSAVRDTAVIELLDHIADESNTAWHPEKMVRSELPSKVKRFCSITAVSRAFTLNKKQHFALKKIGVAFIRRWRKSECMCYLGVNVEEALRDDQIRFYLGGDGGIGKSRVIEAAQTLCVSWGQPNCLVKTALTGKAATLIGGRTFESFLLQLDGEKATTTTVDLDLLIVDEVSMMKKMGLVRLDRLLRIAKRLPNVPFGGIHIVLVGDFLQLPPVGADPIFRDPSLRPKRTATDFTGYHLWRSFEGVIVLGESVRFQDDPAWGHGCHDARLGIWSPEFVALKYPRGQEGRCAGIPS